MLGKDKVEALACAGAFAPDEGQKVDELTTRFRGSSWRSQDRENLR